MPVHRGHVEAGNGEEPALDLDELTARARESDAGGKNALVRCAIGISDAFRYYGTPDGSRKLPPGPGRLPGTYESRHRR